MGRGERNMTISDKSRLWEIERELDGEFFWKPDRTRLQRENKRLKARLEGRDPRRTVGLPLGHRGPIPTGKQADYKVKKQVVLMLEVLTKRKYPEWWEYYDGKTVKNNRYRR